jgi:uncharacterized membrane protein YdjX (TVP38/TMEM64 family)
VTYRGGALRSTKLRDGQTPIEARGTATEMAIGADRTGTERWRRWLPAVLLVAVTVFAFAMGWHRYLSLETIGRNYAALRAFIAAHQLLALLLYFGMYVAVVALSLPGGLVMTLTGGLLFGAVLATPVTVVAATMGATIVFLVARHSFGADRSDAAPWLDKLREGFQDNALSYMLFLRLVPIFPFVVVNLAPALLGVPLSTYVIGTLIGIVPGTLAFSFAGAGLASAIEAQNNLYADCWVRAKSEPGLVCKYGVDPSALVTPELLAGLALLGLVALLPIVAKTWSKRHER